MPVVPDAMDDLDGARGMMLPNEETDSFDWEGRRDGAPYRFLLSDVEYCIEC